jgi:hypothetical protein
MFVKLDHTAPAIHTPRRVLRVQMLCFTGIQPDDEFRFRRVQRDDPRGQFLIGARRDGLI